MCVCVHEAVCVNVHGYVCMCVVLRADVRVRLWE